MKKTIHIAICLLLTCIQSPAVEDIAPEEVGQEPGISGNISISYSSKSGNTEQDESDVGGKLKYDSNRSYLAFIQGTYEKTKSSDIKTEDEALLHSRYLHKLNSDTLYGEGFIQYYENVFQGIDHRVLAGGNVRWRFFHNTDLGKLFLGVGIFDEELNYTDDFPEEDKSMTRFNSYLAYTLQLTEKTEFSLIGYFQPAYDTANDYYTSLNAELTVHVISDLHIRLLYELEYDSRPPEGIEKTDTEITTSLVWKF
jgi:putative salt-induced outer membrane protein YdiY